MSLVLREWWKLIRSGPRESANAGSGVELTEGPPSRKKRGKGGQPPIMEK
jgi:hypothetical protein